MDKTLLKQLVDSLRNSHGVNGFCQNLLIGPLQTINAVGVWIAKLNATAQLQISAESNALGITLYGKNVPLLLDTPLSISVRLRKLYSTPEIPKDWLGGENLPPNLLFSSFPIHNSLLVGGALMIGHSDSKESITWLEENHDVLDVIAGLSFELNSSFPYKRGTSQISNAEILTTRQLKILTGIRDGLTNYQIARILNVSESTVKQESIRIYRFLEVNNRQDAVDVARDRGLFAPATESVAGN